MDGRQGDQDVRQAAFARLQQADELRVAGRADLAERLAREALVTLPDRGVAHAILALSLVDQDKDREALAAADQAVSIDPNLGIAHHARARALVGLHRPFEAELEARDAIRLEPDEANYHGLLGLILATHERTAEALQVTREGLAIKPTHRGCLQAHALALIVEHRTEEAHAVLRAALRDAPACAWLHVVVGMALEDQALPAAAAVEYREALRLDPHVGLAAERLRRTNSWYARMLPSYWLAWFRNAARGTPSVPPRPPSPPT